MQGDRLVAVFNQFDLKHDGKIDFEELRTVMGSKRTFVDD